jgi:hypothetical protein
VVAAAGELSPLVTGIVYCNTIAFCWSVYELRHAREWTDALTQWCEGQPEMVAHNGLCLVHRAEIMQLRGAWGDALGEARAVAARFTEGVLVPTLYPRDPDEEKPTPELGGDLVQGGNPDGVDALQPGLRFEPLEGLARLHE